MQTLHLGNKQTPLAHVIPDDKHPGMWRIRWPDGELSDMVNLARAKDAAVVLASQRYPEVRTNRLRWKACESPPVEPPMRQTAPEAAQPRSE
jgi:hypothetical protein